MKKLAVVRRVSDGRFRVYDRNGRSKGAYATRAEAERRLDQIEIQGNDNSNELLAIADLLTSMGEKDMAERLMTVIASDNDVDLKPELSYSYMMRELRQDDAGRLKKFMVVFKKAFDKAFVNGIEEPEKIALIAALKAIDYDNKE